MTQTDTYVVIAGSGTVSFCDVSGIPSDADVTEEVMAALKDHFDDQALTLLAKSREAEYMHLNVKYKLTIEEDK